MDGFRVNARFILVSEKNQQVCLHSQRDTMLMESQFKFVEQIVANNKSKRVHGQSMYPFFR